MTPERNFLTSALSHAILAALLEIGICGVLYLVAKGKPLLMVILYVSLLLTWIAVTMRSGSDGRGAPLWKDASA